MAADDSAIAGRGPGCRDKALQINLDPGPYGSFAEIGAGQEVARWFFRVGGAAGTVAKTMSAYDMAVSDDIYGRSPRYVSEARLDSMLRHEYDLLVARLDERRGASTRFFAFADTVAARGYQRPDQGHGWMGVRFQSEPRSPSSDIAIHARLLDRENVQQQEALGILGVNLIHGAFYLHSTPERLLGCLLDNLGSQRVEVDLVRFSGPAFAEVDNRLMALQLVEQGLTPATMFSASGSVAQAADLLHDRPVLVARGSFRPVTKLTADMLRCGFERFIEDPSVDGPQAAVVMEMTLQRLAAGEGPVEHQDFLHRADTLGLLGRPVLISNFAHHYQLASFFQRCTRKRVGMVMGVPGLLEIFDENRSADLEGGVLESFGRMFKNGLRLFVYPRLDPRTGALVSAADPGVAPHLRHLLAYLLETGLVQPLSNVDEACLKMRPRHVLELMQAGDQSWETMVPPRVAALIRERGLFHCTTCGKAAPTPV